MSASTPDSENTRQDKPEKNESSSSSDRHEDESNSSDRVYTGLTIIDSFINLIDEVLTTTTGWHVLFVRLFLLSFLTVMGFGVMAMYMLLTDPRKLEPLLGYFNQQNLIKTNLLPTNPLSLPEVQPLIQSLKTAFEIAEGIKGMGITSLDVDYVSILWTTGPDMLQLKALNTDSPFAPNIVSMKIRSFVRHNLPITLDLSEIGASEKGKVIILPIVKETKAGQVARGYVFMYLDPTGLKNVDEYSIVLQLTKIIETFEKQLPE